MEPSIAFGTPVLEPHDNTDRFGSHAGAAPVEQPWYGSGDAKLAIRQIRAADYPPMQAFVRTLSRETAYKRLMSTRTPSDDELRRWTDIDPSRECAWVALGSTPEGEQLVGVARYAMESPDQADFAIVLADAWQGRGLGRELLTRLVTTARERGVRTLSGTTLSENLGMQSLARRVGFRARRTAGAAFYTTLSLDLLA
jgi:acetyltransferase